MYVKASYLSIWWDSRLTCCCEHRSHLFSAKVPATHSEQSFTWSQVDTISESCVPKTKVPREDVANLDYVPKT